MFNEITGKRPKLHVSLATVQQALNLHSKVGIETVLPVTECRKLLLKPLKVKIETVMTRS